MAKKTNIWIVIILIILAGVVLNSFGVIDLGFFSSANGASVASASSGGGGLI